MKINELKTYRVMEENGYVLAVLLGTESTNHDVKAIVRDIRKKDEKRPIYINVKQSAISKIVRNEWIYIPEMNRIHTEVLVDCILSSQGEEEIKCLYTSKRVEKEIELKAEDIADKFKFVVSTCCKQTTKTNKSNDGERFEFTVHCDTTEIEDEEQFFDMIESLGVSYNL